MMELIYKDEVFAVIGAAIEVHRQLGPGFLEPVYQEAMEIEFSTRGIPYAAQRRIQIKYLLPYIRDKRSVMKYTLR